jgi:sugar porter (SP) family MFS transporter
MMQRITVPDAAVSVRSRAVRPGVVFFFGSLGALLWGYDNGVIASALLYIKPEFHLTPAQTGLISSFLSVGSVIGAAGSGFLANKLGRKRLIFIASLVFMVGIVLAATSSSVGMLMAARTVIGVGIGIVSLSIPLYLAEIAPAAIRGRVGAYTQLMVACGILCAYLVGLAFSASHAWRAMFAVMLIPAAVLAAGVWILPESPRWLLRKGRVDEARRQLARRVSGAELETAMAEMQATASRRTSAWRQLLRPGMLKVALIAVLLETISPLTGTNTIVYFAPLILKKIGFSDNASLLNTIGFGVVAVVFTIIAARVIDTWGRRPMMYVGALVMAAAMITMAALSWTAGLTVGVGGFIAIGALTVYKATFSLSWGTTTRIVVSELLSTSVRGPVQGVALTFNYASTFILTLIFPILLAAGSGIAFMIFGVVGIIAFFVVFFIQPETKGRTLEEIELSVTKAPVTSQ